MTARDSRQMATGIAAFIVTALLILASAPADQGSGLLRADGSMAATLRTAGPASG